MKALSVRAPWWWFILHAQKDIENRDWYTKFRGSVLIHVGKWWNEEDVDWDIEDAEDMYEKTNGSCIAPAEGWLDLKECCGCVVGQVEIVDCVTHSNSPWFQGKFGFVLRNPVIFEIPFQFKGALGFFDVPDDLVAKAKAGN